LVSVLGTLVVVFLSYWPNSPPRSRVTFQIQAPPGSRLPLDTPAVSNDGRVAYTVIDHDGVKRLHVSSIEGGDTRVLLGTEGAFHPVWSPAEDALAFTARQRLKRVDLSNGSVRDLIRIGLPWEPAWNQNDDIVLRSEGKLVRVSGNGDNSTPIPNSSGLRFPAFLQDGKRFLVLASNDGVNLNSIQLGSLDSAERTLVIDNVQSAPILAPTPGGKTYLLFERDSHLFAQEFDEVSGKVLGTSAVLIPYVGLVGDPAFRPAVGVSASGNLAYQNQAATTTTTLTWLNRSGAPVEALSPEVYVSRPRLSPDQSSLVGTRPSGGQNIWVTNLNRPSARRLTFGDALESFPVWSSDGSRVAYFRSLGGIYAADADGGGESQLLTESYALPTSWWGKHLLYTAPEPPLSKLYMLDVTTKEVTQVGSAYGHSFAGEFSPDGNYIAFCSDQAGRHEVYVRPVPPGAGETQVSLGGGLAPRWNGDGTELFFVSLDGDLMAADMKLGKPVADPARLFSLGRDGYTRQSYVVARDGQRFLVASPQVASPPGVDAPITVVLNWWVMLERGPGR